MPKYPIATVQPPPVTGMGSATGVAVVQAVQPVVAPVVTMPIMIAKPDWWDVTVTELASTGMLYGETNTYKTTQAFRLAKWIYETYGLPSRHITTDLGGIDHVRDYIDVGIVDSIAVTGSTSPLSQLRALCRGCWKPVIEVGGKQKFRSPLMVEEERRDAKTGLVYKVKVRQLQEPIGMYIIEGATSIANRIMNYLTQKGQKLTEPVSSMFTEESMIDGMGEEIYATPGRSHYGFVQQFFLSLLINFASLPVKYVLWTAHEGKAGEDKESNVPMPVLGPGIIGKAATAALPPQIGDLFHIETVDLTSGQVVQPGQDRTKLITETRAYFVKHPDSQISSILWPAKPRFPEGKLDRLWKEWPDGYIVLSRDRESAKGNIHGFFSLRQSVEAEGTDELKKWKEEQDRKRAASLAAVEPATEATTTVEPTSAVEVVTT